MSDYAGDVTRTIGERVREFRGDRSLQWLESRTGELGMRVGRGAISRLENGRRDSVSVTEWLVLAEALGVFPPELLVGSRCFDRVVLDGGDAVRAVGRAREALSELGRVLGGG